MTSKILLVDDEAAICEMILFSLKKYDFDITTAADNTQAMIALAEQCPDLILLDWMLPDGSGVELARRLKQDPNYQDIPIIMLTARGAEDDKIRGLEVGADDYITKPFSPRELAARIKAVLRRTSSSHGNDVISSDGLEINLKGHRVSANNQDIELGPTEFRLLKFFILHSDRVYSRSQLLDQVWGNNVYVEERTVDVHIRRLRKALEPFGFATYVQTVRGAGYRFSNKV